MKVPAWTRVDEAIGSCLIGYVNKKELFTFTLRCFPFSFCFGFGRTRSYNLLHYPTHSNWLSYMCYTLQGLCSYANLDMCWWYLIFSFLLTRHQWALKFHGNFFKLWRVDINLPALSLSLIKISLYKHARLLINW